MQWNLSGKELIIIVDIVILKESKSLVKKLVDVHTALILKPNPVKAIWKSNSRSYLMKSFKFKQLWLSKVFKILMVQWCTDSIFNRIIYQLNNKNYGFK